MKDDPEQHFYELKNALDEYKNEFDNNVIITQSINNALKKIDLIVEEIKSELPKEEYDKEEELLNRNSQKDTRIIVGQFLMMLIVGNVFNISVLEV